jgi:hypothetical protein
MNYYYDLPDDIIDAITEINIIQKQEEDRKFQSDFIDHKFSFSPLRPFIKGRCRGSMCFMEGELPSKDADGRICVGCYFSNDVDKVVFPEVIESVAAGDVDEVVNENEEALAILKKGFDGETHCSCEWSWDDHFNHETQDPDIHCRMCVENGQDPTDLKQDKYDWFKMLIVYYLDGEEVPEDPTMNWNEGGYGDEPQPELGGLTIEEYVLKYANIKDERFVGWEDERLGKYIEPWVCSFTPIKDD